MAVTKHERRLQRQQRRRAERVEAELNAARERDDAAPESASADAVREQDPSTRDDSDRGRDDQPYEASDKPTGHGRCNPADASEVDQPAADTADVSSEQANQDPCTANPNVAVDQVTSANGGQCAEEEDAVHAAAPLRQQLSEHSNGSEVSTAIPFIASHLNSAARGAFVSADDAESIVRGQSINADDASSNEDPRVDDLPAQEATVMGDESLNDDAEDGFETTTSHAGLSVDDKKLLETATKSTSCVFVSTLDSSTDDMKVAIAKLERDIHMLVVKKQNEKAYQQAATSDEEHLGSLTPSESTTDATDSLSSDERMDVQMKHARVDELTVKLALLQRKAEVLEAEKLYLVEAAEKQEDYRSKLLEAQVNQRTLALKFHRALQSLEEQQVVPTSEFKAHVAELHELAAALRTPHNLHSATTSCSLPDLIVFPPQSHSRPRKRSKSSSWLWDSQQTASGEYSVYETRHNECLMKKRRSAIFTAPRCTGDHDGNAPEEEPKRHLLQLKSPPKPTTTKVNFDSSSSDEEEYECDVDASGKVTARANSQPPMLGDPGVDDLFLAISM